MNGCGSARARLVFCAAATIVPLFGQNVTFLASIGGSEEADNASSLALDGGSLYVTGWRGRPASQPAAFLSKYRIDGQLSWTTRLEPGSHAMDVAVDAGGTYVVGSAFTLPAAVGGQRSAGNLDAMIVKYNKEGVLLWGKLFGTAGPDSAMAAATSGGSIYVTVTLVEDVQRPPAALLLKFDASGTELWRRQIGGLAGTFGLAAGSAGVYVVGETYQAGFTNRRGFLRSYDFSGTENWARDLGATYPFSVAANASGIYVAGQSQGNHYVWKYDSDGQPEWQRQISRFRGESPKVAVDDTGVYAHLSTVDALPGQCRAGALDATLTKYNYAGVDLWTRQFGSVGQDSAARLAAGETGLYLATRFDLERQRPGFLARIEKSPALVDETRPRIQNECVLNAASYEGGAVAPGEIVTILGSGIGPAQPAPLTLTQEGRVASTLAGTRVLFDGVAAPLLYASAKQTTAIVPYSTAGKEAVEVVVEYSGVRSDAVKMPVQESRPGIFTQGDVLDSTGARLAAVVNQDGTINSLGNPASRGSVVSIYATGEGLTTPSVDEGLIVRGVAPTPVLPVKVAIGSEFEDSLFGNRYFPAQVLYAGAVPGSVAGLLQINARIPEGMPTEGRSGYWNLNLTIGKESIKEDLFFGHSIYIAVR